MNRRKGFIPIGANAPRAQEAISQPPERARREQMKRTQRKAPRPTKLGDRVVFMKSGHRGEVVDQRDSDKKFAVSTAMREGEVEGKVWAAEVELMRIHDSEPLDVVELEPRPEGWEDAARKQLQAREQAESKAKADAKATAQAANEARARGE